MSSLQVVAEHSIDAMFQPYRRVSSSCGGIICPIRSILFETAISALATSVAVSHLQAHDDTMEMVRFCILYLLPII